MAGVSSRQLATLGMLEAFPELPGVNYLEVSYARSEFEQAQTPGRDRLVAGINGGLRWRVLAG